MTLLWLRGRENSARRRFSSHIERQQWLLGAALLLFTVAPALAADHPSIPSGKECIACHADRPAGKSVHFDFEQSCTVCHVVTVEESKTSITLSLPKEQICYACHEKAEMDKAGMMKGQCTDCHDPHSSSRPYLLVKDVATPHKIAKK